MNSVFTIENGIAFRTHLLINVDLKRNKIENDMPIRFQIDFERCRHRFSQMWLGNHFSTIRN